MSNLDKFDFVIVIPIPYGHKSFQNKPSLILSNSIWIDFCGEWGD